MGIHRENHSRSEIKIASLNYPLILEIITNFYQKATYDFLIGYHFRKIEDFDTHLPRIASFWQLQLTGKITHRDRLPFNLIAAHAPLGVKKGELGRWITLFEETLKEHVLKKDIDEALAAKWMEKARFFEKRLQQKLVRPS